MRGSIAAAAAVLLVVSSALGVAACSWKGGRPEAPERAEHGSTPPPPLRRLAAVHRVEPAQLDRQLARLQPGHVVLDLHALESLDAAEELTAHWRSIHPHDAQLVCWLRPEGDALALAQAVNALSDAGCSVLNVALDDPLTVRGAK